MLETIVPGPLDHLPSVRLSLISCLGALTHLVLLYCSVVHHSDIVVYVEIEQRARLPSSFVDNEIIKGIVLHERHPGCRLT
jgi:DNA-binding MltR family transcriptional regulator